MARTVESLRNLCLELLGLTATMGGVVVIAAYWHFGGFGTALAQRAVLFCLLVLGATAIPLQLYVVVRIGRLKAENGRLFHVATRDGLTRVLNRAAFKQRVEAEIAAIGRRRTDNDQFTLLILDADHFKRINDRLGHAAGDEALVAIAAMLGRQVRRDDIVGRLGGEEFGILLRRAGFEEARVVAERLRHAINGLSVGPRAAPARLSVSLGGISFRSAVAFDALYRLADANLYRAKRNGRNRVDLTNLASLGRYAAEPPRLSPPPPAGAPERRGAGLKETTTPSLRH